MQLSFSCSAATKTAIAVSIELFRPHFELASGSSGGPSGSDGCRAWSRCADPSSSPELLPPPSTAPLPAGDCDMSATSGSELPGSSTGCRPCCAPLLRGCTATCGVLPAVRGVCDPPDGSAALPRMLLTERSFGGRGECVVGVRGEPGPSPPLLSAVALAGLLLMLLLRRLGREPAAEGVAAAAAAARVCRFCVSALPGSAPAAPVPPLLGVEAAPLVPTGTCRLGRDRLWPLHFVRSSCYCPYWCWLRLGCKSLAGDAIRFFGLAPSCRKLYTAAAPHLNWAARLRSVCGGRPALGRRASLAAPPGLCHLHPLPPVPHPAERTCDSEAEPGPHVAREAWHAHWPMLLC